MMRDFLFTEVLKVTLSMIYKIIILFKLLKLIFLYNFEYYCFFVIFITGILVFSSLRKHLLLTLLSLEYLVLCVFIFLVFFVIKYFGDIYLILVFLTFSVCEGVLGLSILVSLIRCHGNDNINSLSIIKW